MRFKKGVKVEVLSKEQGPTSSWLCGEIISGNGRTYEVKFGLIKDPMVGRVPRKIIRPCPPLVRRVIHWAMGDIVEVFHNLSWKMASIVNVMENNEYLVKVLGTQEVLETCSSHMRVRLCWQDEKWYFIGKGLRIGQRPAGKRPPGMRTKIYDGDGWCHAQKNTEAHKSSIVSTRKLKRDLVLNSCDREANPFVVQKKRLISKDGLHQQIFSTYPHSFEKVDEVVYRSQVFYNTSIQSPFHIAAAISHQMNTGEKSNSLVVQMKASVDTDSCTSSVGSCSRTHSSAYDLALRFSRMHDKNVREYDSDAESCCGSYHKEKAYPFSSEKDSGVGVYRSGLYIYHYAVRTLYNSGSLSWDDQEKLMDLRSALHISDDEHLTVLRDLMSGNRFSL